MHSDAFVNFAGPDATEDVIEVEIMPNGIIKITTDPISGANHTSAEGLLDAIQFASGGPVAIQPRGHADHNITSVRREVLKQHSHN